MTADSTDEVLGDDRIAALARWTGRLDCGMEDLHHALVELQRRRAAQPHGDRVDVVARLGEQLEAARRECDRLRRMLPTFSHAETKAQRDALIRVDVERRAEIRALLADAPVVSEEEVERRDGWGRDASVLLAAARQLHALRAGLRRLAGGPTSTSSTSPRSSTVVDAVRALLVVGSTDDPLVGCPECGRSDEPDRRLRTLLAKLAQIVEAAPPDGAFESRGDLGKSGAATAGTDETTRRRG